MTLVIPLIMIFRMESWLGAAMIGAILIYCILFRIFRKPVYRAQHAFLDEPTSAMDRESRKRFVEYLGSIRRDKIIFISTHDEDLLKICTGTIRLGPREAAE